VGEVEELRRFLGQRLVLRSDPLAERLASGRDGVAAVVLYGSRLAGGAAADSERDYFVLVDSLSAYHRDAAHALANRLLPPGVYHPSVNGERCKVSVLSLAQLARETGARSRDLHHLGRFSKPLEVAWARDRRAFERVRDAQAAALVTLTPLARGLLATRFTVEELMLSLYGLSYLGERRVTEPVKIRTIFEARRADHLALGALLLAAEGVARPLGGGWFAQSEPAEEHRRALALVRRSRRRSLARWPMYLYTFDGWLDYALAKVARHTGARVQLSGRARRHPLLYGWPALFALRKRGLLT
jgi:hypothetical protein